MTTFRSPGLRSSITSHDLNPDLNPDPNPGRSTSPPTRHGSMTVAQIASTITDGPLPFRLTAFDGSQAGLPGVVIAMHRARR